MPVHVTLSNAEDIALWIVEHGAPIVQAAGSVMVPEKHAFALRE